MRRGSQPTHDQGNFARQVPEHPQIGGVVRNAVGKALQAANRRRDDVLDESAAAGRVLPIVQGRVEIIPDNPLGPARSGEKPIANFVFFGKLLAGGNAEQQIRHVENVQVFLT